MNYKHVFVILEVSVSHFFLWPSQNVYVKCKQNSKNIIVFNWSVYESLIHNGL